MSEGKRPHEERLAHTIARHRERRETSSRSLAARIAFVGSLGWVVLTPVFLGTWGGRWLDVRLGTGVFWTAAGLMLGTGLGTYMLWRSLPGEGGNGA